VGGSSEILHFGVAHGFHTVKGIMEVVRPQIASCRPMARNRGHW
jgi:hypothetical protein